MQVAVIALDLEKLGNPCRSSNGLAGSRAPGKNAAVPAGGSRVTLQHHAALAQVVFGMAAAATCCGCDGQSLVPAKITIRVHPDGVPSYTGETRNAALVAFNGDGGDSWTELKGTDGVYHAVATDWRYAVAVGCRRYDYHGTVGGLRLYFQGVTDTTDLNVSGCPGDRETVPVTIELDGVPSGMSTEVSLGNTSIDVGDRQAVELMTPKGTVDVFATSYEFVPGTLAAIPVRGYRAPDPIDLTGPYSLKIDYGALALPFETHALRVTGFDPADGFAVRSSYATPHSLTQWYLAGEVLDEVYASDPDTTYEALDPRMRQPDDISNLRVHTHSSSGGLTYDRYVRLAMKDPVAQAVELPPRLVVAPPALDSSANRTVTVTLPMTPATLATADYTVWLRTTAQGDADQPVAHGLDIYVQSGWALGQSSVTIATPDLTLLRGWDSDMALYQGFDVDWWIYREDRTMPYDTLPVDGRKILLSVVQGQIHR
jgi:hypothetical protein